MDSARPNSLANSLCLHRRILVRQHPIHMDNIVDMLSCKFLKSRLFIIVVVDIIMDTGVDNEADIRRDTSVD